MKKTTEKDADTCYLWYEVLSRLKPITLILKAVLLDQTVDNMRHYYYYIVQNIYKNILRKKTKISLSAF